MNAGESARYQRRLLILLSSAGFFATYDASVLALLLPNIQSTFGVGEATLGLVRIPIELGLVAALFVARLADRVGRRPLLLWSIVGYTAATALTAVSWDVWSFAAFQFAARVFVGAELAVAVTMVVEELPTGRRARGLGLLLAVEALGTIAVAVLLAAGLQETGLGWRAFFLAGLAPLVVLAHSRRSIRETERFSATASGGRSGGHSSLLAPWRHPTRPTLVAVGLVYLLRSVPLYGAVAWWAYFAQRERGFSETDVGLTVLTAYGLGCAGYYVCGRLMERIGRRATALVYLPVAIASTIALFQVRSPVVGFVALFLAVATGLGLQPVLSAFATEPFPTEIRAQAAAWARNGFEIAGLVLGPALVGVLGDHVSGPVGSVGDAASLLALVALPALYVVWRHLPETRGRDLVDVSPEPPRPAGARPWRVRAAAGAAVAVLAGTVALLAAGRSEPRPEGRAERWLDAVGDTGRPGSQADARARAASIGDLALAAPLRAWGPDPRGYFASLEVGRSRRAGADVAVPFRVRRDDHSGGGVVVLHQDGGTWRVAALGPRRPAPADRVPSEGGPSPGGAGGTAWVASAAAAGLVGLACALGLRRRPTNRPTIVDVASAEPEAGD